MKPIREYPPGSLVRIAELGSCRKSRCRMCAMGLTPGTEVEVLSNGMGPCRLRVRGTDVALGRGMSTRVMAVPADTPLPLPRPEECDTCDDKEAGPCGGKPS
ncbi:MAG: ferrous iron transport protein A [Desulfovibrio sp.]|nr:MAG: ferrous iron transport protein A [Desulfovibrio sp.]